MTPQTLPSRADVVVIGGGVMGTSVAYHLARAGVTDVVLLESHDLAAGSSGKPLGGVRAQFSGRLNIELGARSLGAFERFAEEVGTEIGLEQVGYLFILRTPEQLAAFEDAIAIQNDRGVPSRLIDPGEARRLCPYLVTDGVLAAAFSPTDGYAVPSAVVGGYADAARRLGASVHTGCGVVGIDTTDGTDGAGARITAVRTERGTVETSTVVCTAGAWSAQIGRMAGVDLPVVPLRRQIALTPPLTPQPPRIPFTIDYGSTFYVHNNATGLLLGMADPHQPPGFDTTYTEDWLPQLRRAAAAISPELAGVPLTGGWAGLYEMTPDCNAVIGEAPHVGRFLYAAGFSGHGFLQGPAVGEVIRDLYLGRTPPVDVAAFDAARFSLPASRTEVAIV